MTSNLGANYIDRMQKIGFGKGKGKGEGEGDKEDYEQIKTRVMDSMKEFFRPEFMNRIDDIIVFDILAREAIQKIVKIQVDLVKERLASKEIKLDVNSGVYEYLAKEGYSPQYGARPLKRLIQNKILTPVASMMISKGIMKGGAVSVGMKDGQFTFDVKKGRKGSLIQEDLVSTDA